MNKLEIHAMTVGFSAQQNKEIAEIVAPLAINMHYCDFDIQPDKLPRTHVILLNPDVEKLADGVRTYKTHWQKRLEESELIIENEEFNIGADDNREIGAEQFLEKFIEQINLASPYGFVYLMAPEDKILSLTQAQQNLYRDFIIYPVNPVFLQKRLLRIFNDLQDKFVQLLKKRRLKKVLVDKDTESARLKNNLNSALHTTKESNKQLIRMLSNQVFARMGQRASGRNQQLNLLLSELSKACGFTEEEIHDLTNAWHLRNIGKMTFSDRLLQTPYIQLSIEEQRTFNCHPTLSHAAMMIVRPLDKAAKIVLQHKEYIDGSGYPKGIKGDEISQQAKVLAVVNDYTELIAGRYSDRDFSTAEALAFLNNYATEKYDDEIVNKLVKILPRLSKSGKGMYDLLVQSADLKVGMSLSRDIISADGTLLLSEGLRLDRGSVSRLQEMEINLQERFKIFIKQK